MTSTPASIVARALLALGLMIGFYGLAISIALGLLYLPYAEVVYAHRLHFKLALFAIGGAVIILIAIAPRPDRFRPPGPVLAAAAQPALFDLINDVATRTGQSIPREVYLVPDVNAWVADRGGFIGLGGRRVMGLGLPLLSTLTVPELRGVLAHEFGHFHGGDTKLGRLVYQTHGAIARTVGALQERDSWLQWPFLIYARLFLRVSHAVSRYQELTADRLAAETIGAGALAAGLRKVEGAAMAFQPYWSTEVTPVVNAGYRPPIADGFRRFLNGPLGAPAVEAAVQRALEQSAQHPYDTHPPLAVRLDSLRALPAGDSSGDDRPVIELVHDVDMLERSLFEWAQGSNSPTRLRPITWEDAGSLVYSSLWENAAARHSGLTVVRNVGDLADRAPAAVDAIAAQASWEGSSPAPEEERRRYAVWVLGAALGAALARRQWSVHTLPGEPVSLAGPGWSFDPFAMAQQLASETFNAAEWRQRCDSLSISKLELWPAPSDTASTTGTGPQASRTEVRLITRPLKSSAGTVVIRCWQCKEALPLSADTRGKEVRCPKCSTKQRLPS